MVLWHRGDCFNPRPRTGANRGEADVAGFGVVSIRAPVRGRTNTDVTVKAFNNRFQSAPPYGGELAKELETIYSSGFQSAPPYGGERPRGHGHRPPRTGFNPRPRTGANLNRVASGVTYEEFQSAPPTGANHEPTRRVRLSQVSIRAPVRGRTASNATSSPPPSVSIRAPVRGRTKASSHDLALKSRFQSAPPYGGERCPRAPGGAYCGGFNPRPRTGANLSWRMAVSNARCFNPRPRTGANGTQSRTAGRSFRVSIRAPVRGRTVSARKQASRFASFNPRPRTGANAMGGGR